MLLLKRSDAQHLAGFWSFPGGKVESAESEQSAAVRELQEETGLIGSGWQVLGLHTFDYPDRRLHFTLFKCHCVNIESLDCESGHVWTKPHLLSEFSMPEANNELIRILLLKQ